MYNSGFGAYPQDDMNMGVNSYFSESDTNFFGDTSNDSFFGEGCGVTGFGNGEFFNESVGFSTDGSEVVSEAYGMEYGNSSMFTESSDDVFVETKVPVRKQSDVPESFKKSARAAYDHYESQTPGAGRLVSAARDAVAQAKEKDAEADEYEKKGHHDMSKMHRDMAAGLRDVSRTYSSMARARAKSENEEIMKNAPAYQPATKSTKSTTYPKPGSVKPATKENLEALRKDSMSKYDQEALRKAWRDTKD